MVGIGEQNRWTSAHSFAVISRMSPTAPQPASPENLARATAILAPLVANGLTDLYLAPGARSVPIVAAASQFPRLRSRIHFDERGMAFAALGHARTTGRPTAILTTSGSAVANLWPAVIEASLGAIPLILLTADRPARLRGTGANQTIHQPGIFGREVRWQIDLPLSPPTRFLEEWMHSAWCHSLAPLPGPVHINCPFDEPLLTDDEIPGRETITLPAPAPLPESPAAFTPPPDALFSIPDGILLVGALPPTLQKSVAALLPRISQRLGWPVIADALSGLNGCPGVIQHADLLVQSRHFAPPGAVLHFGGGIVTKPLLEWLGQTRGSNYYHVPAVPLPFDPWGLRPRVLSTSIPDCLAWLTDNLPSTPHPSTEKWTHADEATTRRVSELLDSQDGRLTEPGILRAVSHAAAERGFGLLLGNSMPVRHFQSFVGLLPARLSVQGNRGTSGIDGNIATLAGMNNACQTSDGANLPSACWGILGDLATLHDLNSLALLAALQPSSPATLFVINNQGGGIFPFLRLPLEPAFRERWLESPHTHRFDQAAALFGLSYARPESSADLADLLGQLTLPRLVELPTSRSGTRNLIRHIHKNLRNLPSSRL